MTVQFAPATTTPIRCDARLAGPLVGRRVDVVGLDTSSGAVATACERGVVARLGNVARPDGGLGRFDTFLMLGNNLGLLGSADQAHEVLTNLARLARPGARLYGTTVDPDAVELPADRPTGNATGGAAACRGRRGCGSGPVA